MVIRGYKTKATERFLAGEPVNEFQAFATAAAKALTRLQAAVRLGDLRNPPSNRFEALSGKRKGQYSIRINDRWRICFVWVPLGEIPEGTDALSVAGEPDEVEIVDYH
jgi:proteic killer suppression protein